MHTIFVLQIIFLPFFPLLLGDSLTMFVLLESDESVQLFAQNPALIGSSNLFHFLRKPVTLWATDHPKKRSLTRKKVGTFSFSSDKLCQISRCHHTICFCIQAEKIYFIFVPTYSSLWRLWIKGAKLLLSQVILSKIAPSLVM